MDFTIFSTLVFKFVYRQTIFYFQFQNQNSKCFAIHLDVLTSNID